MPIVPLFKLYPKFAFTFTGMEALLKKSENSRLKQLPQTSHMQLQQVSCRSTTISSSRLPASLPQAHCKPPSCLNSLSKVSTTSKSGRKFVELN
jgi:hypothetical protein